MTSSPPAAANALALVTREVQQLAGRIDPDELETFVTALANADRIFVHGAGRSGIALRMTAMRLMHLGLAVHIVGDATCPAIREGDVLLTASGSGTTEGIVRAAEAAVAAGATIAAITTAPTSPLAVLAAATITIPAAAKLDRSATASQQYAGSLFEQCVVTLGDALFHTLWIRSGLTADDIWPRHSNLE